MTVAEDWLALAQTLDRSAFVERCDCLLLVGQGALRVPARPTRTGFFDITAIQQAVANKALAATGGDAAGPEAAAEPSPPAELVVRAVRKTQPSFPNMISVGRTPNNDIHLNDTHVSRFHAFFQPEGDGMKLGDPGSRMGTFVDGVRLVPKADPIDVRPGAVIRFADVEFTLCDAGAAWDRIQGRR